MITVSVLFALWFFVPQSEDADSVLFKTTNNVLQSDVGKASDGYVMYTDTSERFSFMYPKTLNVQYYNEGRGAETIVFQNIKTTQGFQVYIVPYTEDTVSTQQFEKDQPSGIQDELTNIKVDGATGASFYSQHTLLGKTYEVWFIKNGYLYEVTTLASLDTFVNDIIETWKFKK